MVPDEMSVTDLLSRLGRFDVVVVDVDNTLAPDDAPAAELRARLDAAHAAADRSGIGRLVVASNGSLGRAADGDRVVWEAGKPLTRRSRLGIPPGASVAVVGDKILTDGLMAFRWGAEFYLKAIAETGGRQGWLRRTLSRVVRRLLFTAESIDL